MNKLREASPSVDPYAPIPETYAARRAWMDRAFATTPEFPELGRVLGSDWMTCCGPTADQYRELAYRTLNIISLHTLTSPCGAQYTVLGDDSGDLEACMAPGDILVTEELRTDTNGL